MTSTIFTPNLLIDVFSVESCDWFQEQNCYEQGGDWDPGSCRCYYFNPCYRCDTW
jgi:hypothetical protein